MTQEMKPVVTKREYRNTRIDNIEKIREAIMAGEEPKTFYDENNMSLFFSYIVFETIWNYHKEHMHR